MLQVAPINFWLWGGGVGQVKSVIKKIFLLRGNVTGCTHKILAGGSFWSSQICNIKIFFIEV